MFLSTSFRLEHEEEIEEYVKEKLPELIKDEIFKDENKLNEVIRQCVRGQLKSMITEILQGKDYKDFIRDKVMTEMGMKGHPFDDEYFAGLTHSQIAELAKKAIRLTDEHIKLNAFRLSILDAIRHSEELQAMEFKQYFDEEFTENIYKINGGGLNE